LEYTALAEATATEKGKKEADAYIDRMMDTYETIKQDSAGGEKAAAGMLALMSGNNFDQATVEEMKAA
jgi:hypothetical protein